MGIDVGTGMDVAGSVLRDPSTVSKLVFSAGGFLLALFAVLLVIPAVARRAAAHGLYDTPSARRVHRQPIPRLGGVGIFIAVVLVCALFRVIAQHTRWLGPDPLLMGNRQLLGLAGGALLVFAVGLTDDLRGVRPWIKLVLQACAGIIAYAGGVAIETIRLPGLGMINLGLWSLPVTVSWFLLVINAINLIDGLDGLAAGVVFFSSAVLGALSLLVPGTTVYVYLAALAGATLGFLRYNFSPAIIFMGDSGSYFLGYALAGLSILGTMKAHASLTILSPIIVMGVPLMDAFWSVCRRFLAGKALFGADMDHVHHRFLKLGFTHRRAVLTLYGLTLLLGALAFLMAQASDTMSALVVLASVALMAVVLRGLGYDDYFDRQVFVLRMRSLVDGSLFDQQRRGFSRFEIGIRESQGIEDVWAQTVQAARYLGMDYVRLEIPGADNGKSHPGFQEAMELAVSDRARAVAGFNPDELAVDDEERQTIMQLDLPLCREGDLLGTLRLKKDLAAAPEGSDLRLVEQLRRVLSVYLAGPPSQAATAGRARPVLAPRFHVAAADQERGALRPEIPAVAQGSRLERLGEGPAVTGRLQASLAKSVRQVADTADLDR